MYECLFQDAIRIGKRNSIVEGETRRIVEKLGAAPIAVRMVGSFDLDRG